MIFYQESRETVLEELSSNFSTGLSSSQAEKKLAHFGENKLREKQKKSTLRRFFEQFKDLMILILIAAALVSFVLACLEGEPKEFFEPVLILLIVVLNAVMGVIQESKAEKALEALQNLSAPHARVLRDSVEKEIPSSQLVPGDIIRLEAGDFVPADARLLQSARLKSEESALTGESVPSEKDADAIVKKNAPLGDRSNMLFSGCSITYGTATAIVTATGMNTEMGKIANLLDQEDDTQTPLQKKLENLGKYLGFLALGACAVIFFVGILNGVPTLEIFMTSVSLAVSAIPEGLPAIVTIVLSIGVQRMVKKHAIIRRLPAVETLGSASVICSDKTGTLTQNRMTLVKAYVDGCERLEDISHSTLISENPQDGSASTLTAQNHLPGFVSQNNLEKSSGKISAAVSKLLEYASLCCDGSVIIEEDGDEIHLGDPTETAIVSAALKNGLSKEELNLLYPRVREIPFDSDRKLMSTIHRINQSYLVIVKGAFDVLMTRCTTGSLNAAQRRNEEMSADALRVLAIACKELDTLPEKLIPEELENNLTFLGLIGMIDPPRPEARTAVATCRLAGIKPVMITGDHVVTASAIARDLGILQAGDQAITGTQLDAMSDSELADQVETISVYARVSPENKIRIVKSWQKKGHVVSMTGDGVNDAPALKAADIGCAMGITGTDVAKGAADMTLADDNFATIVDAIREGRGIYANIKKVVGFLLGTNIGEVVVVFLSMIFWHKAPLLSIQLLWINLVTDSLPAIALGMEPVEETLMLQKPKPKEEGLFAHGYGIRIVLLGILFGLLSLSAYRIGEHVTGQNAGGQTLTFMVLSLSQVFHSFNMRSDRSLFQTGLFGNSRLNLAVLVSAALILLLLFTPVSGIFGLIRLPGILYLVGAGLILVPVLFMEQAKAFGLIRPHS